MKQLITTLAVFMIIAAIFTAVTNLPNQAAAKTPEAYYDIGDFHRPVSTESEQAQVWFDRGLAMCHAFNHEEAVRCFEKALEADPSMAMGYWGIAYAWGPNINNMEIEPHQIAQAAFSIRLAKLNTDNATALENELIEALGLRYAVPVPDNRESLNRAYAKAMSEVYNRYQDDPLVATLYAEALINLRPWNHWSPEGEPAEETPEILAVLEQGLGQHPEYPGLCHFYIHAIEASPNPERGLPAANMLRDAMPGAGHLVHMPSHIDVLVGNYHEVIDANQRAIAADKVFLDREGAHNFYTFYRVHNYHFLVYGAMFDGQSELALSSARQIREQIPEDLLRAWTDYFDAFVPTPLHVLVRFGRWEDILREPEPDAFLPMTRSIWHYARAIAYATTGRVELAEREQEAFRKTRAMVPETSILFNNTSRDILGIAEAMMAGEIDYRKGEYETAFLHLREAVRLDDGLNYDEPWGWMQPARHALGALLLEQGRVAEAEQVYRIDLEKHPNNVWALQGLGECLDKQGKSQEATAIRAKFEVACERTDVKINRSCYCRTKGLDDDN